MKIGMVIIRLVHRKFIYPRAILAPGNFICINKKEPAVALFFAEQCSEDYLK
jgi:hypothetical protein